MKTLKIDPDIEKVLTPLTDEELQQLEDSIKADGCRDALVVWQGILIDGHNRYEICQRLGKDPATVEKEFASKDEAIAWVAQNQLGRRNLSHWQKATLGLRLKPFIEAMAKQNQGARNDLLPKSAESCDGQSINTRAEIAETVGLSGETIRQAEFIQDHNDGNKETIDQLDRGEISINKAFKRIEAKTKPPRRQSDQGTDSRVTPTSGPPKKNGYLTVEQALKVPINKAFLLECVLDLLLADDNNDQGGMRSAISDLRSLMSEK